MTRPVRAPGGEGLTARLIPIGAPQHVHAHTGELHAEHGLLDQVVLSAGDIAYPEIASSAKRSVGINAVRCQFQCWVSPMAAICLSIW